MSGINGHEFNCAGLWGMQKCDCKPVQPVPKVEKPHCNNCWQDPVWCGCDVYFEFKGTISGAEAMKIKAKRNAAAGLTSKKGSDSY